MNDRCHKEKVLGHVGKLEQRFPKAHIAATLMGGVAGALGLGATAGLAGGAEAALFGKRLRSCT